MLACVIVVKNLSNIASILHKGYRGKTVIKDIISDRP